MRSVLPIIIRRRGIPRVILAVVVRGSRVAGMVLAIVDIGRARKVGRRRTGAPGLGSVLSVVIRRCLVSWMVLSVVVRRRWVSRMVLPVVIASLVDPSAMEAAGVPKS